MIKLNATLLGALALIATAAPAAARTIETDTRSIDVAVGNLDLGNRDHARQFDRRLRAAAREVCADLNPNGGRMITRCQTEALSGARRDAAAIRLLHEARH